MTPPHGRPPTRRRWTLLVGGVVLGGVMALLAVVAQPLVEARLDFDQSQPAADVVIAHDRAWDTIDCAQYEATSTAALRTAVAPDCAAFTARATQRAQWDHDTTVTSHTATAQSATVFTREQWTANGSMYDANVRYDLVRTPADWLVDARREMSVSVWE